MMDTDWAEAAAMLRALLTDDEATGKRLAAEVEGRGAADTFALVLAVAFIIAVRRHFRDGYSAARVIQLVADVRAFSAEAAEAIDPVGAESLTLVGHEQLSDEELDGFIADVLAEARKAR